MHSFIDSVSHAWEHGVWSWQVSMGSGSLFMVTVIVDNAHGFCLILGFILLDSVVGLNNIYYELHISHNWKLGPLLVELILEGLVEVTLLEELGLCGGGLWDFKCQNSLNYLTCLWIRCKFSSTALRTWWLSTTMMAMNSPSETVSLS